MRNFVIEDKIMFKMALISLQSESTQFHTKYFLTI